MIDGNSHSEETSVEGLISYAQAFSDSFLHVVKRLGRAPLSEAERLGIYALFGECEKCVDDVRSILKKAESWE